MPQVKCLQCIDRKTVCASHLRQRHRQRVQRRQQDRSTLLCHQRRGGLVARQAGQRGGRVVAGGEGQRVSGGTGQRLQQRQQRRHAGCLQVG